MYETGNICISWRRKIIRRSVFNLYHGDHGGTFLGNTEQDRFRKKYLCRGRKCRGVPSFRSEKQNGNDHAYVASGFTAALAGIVLASMNRQAIAKAAQGYDNFVLTALVVGGVR